MRVYLRKYGVLLVEGHVVISKVLAKPGAAHALSDVLAVSATALAPGPKIALLGFAGGGILAPLRALGFKSPIDAVDLSLEYEKWFRKYCSSWAGRVRLTQDEASAWLKRRRGRYDVIIEDLSVNGPYGVKKPEASVVTLPRLMKRRLKPHGLVVVNLLPMQGMSWRELLERVAAPYRRALVVSLVDYENKLVIGGSRLPEGREASRRIRSGLQQLGSRLVGRFRVRTLK
ncbi:hypothetical protein ACFL6M_03505 [Candidatus Eisenbacteria bacterium]|uniref:PABS domain-containing protein n=1 Tax=Eiseniibacteriota bacterium TaxID=2212470 RepID=A0ABV6YJX5_UNCEI